MYTKELICVVGPTAIGKTNVAIQLAKFFGVEIISADSRQFYREMCIGTAKPSVEELASVPHHFIDSLSVLDDYSAGDFERDALRQIDALFKTYDKVILVGGSGLFVDAVCRGLDDLPRPKTGVRESLNAQFQQHGLAPLQAQLEAVDPLYYQEVDIHNPQRIIRALEVFETTGKPFSYYRQQKTAARDFRITKIGLNIDRATLYERINARVDDMITGGLLAEVQALAALKDRPPLLTVGYSELFDYLDGNCSFDEAVVQIKQNTRRYAKRQLTWFKKDQETLWFEPADVRQMIQTLGGDYQ